MKKWVNQLSDSERKLFLIGVVLVSLALFWVLVFKPVNQSIDNMVLTRDRLLTEQVEINGLNVNQYKNSSVSVEQFPDDVTFSSWVDQQFRAVGLQELVNRTEPVDSNTLTVWMNNAPFDQVIDWLYEVNQKYAVGVDQIDVNVTDKSLGLTNIRMRLIK